MAASSSKPHQSAYHGQDLGPGEIRILTIERRREPSLQHVYPWQSKEESLHLVTQRCKLEDKPDFDAVSYVWGTAPASIRISCNDSSILVTPTAHHMLAHLRLENRPLWIDAICINQDDANEKASQIPLMRQIYPGASFVVVWIGASNPSIRTFMLDFPRVWQLAKSWERDDQATGADWRGDDWPIEDSEFWEGAYHLLNHEWFRRLWTFQEIMLAGKAVLVSDSTWIDAMDFAIFISNGMYRARSYMFFNSTVASRIPNNPSESQLAFKSCYLIVWSREEVYKDGYDTMFQRLPTLFCELGSRRAKEAVDRVWAISGLLDERLQDQLTPLVDYSERGRKEYWETYVRFSRVVFGTGASLALLNLPPTKEPEDAILPSWCPDFSKRPTCMMLLDCHWNSPIRTRGERLGALLFEHEDDGPQRILERDVILDHSLKLISVSEHDNLLRVRGFIVDTVSEVIEDRFLKGRRNYIEDSGWRHWTMENPIHVATVGMYDRALTLARRVLLGLDNSVLTIPSEYLMSFFVDTRITKQAEIAYKDAIIILTTGGFDYYESLGSVRKGRAYQAISHLVSLIGHSFFSTKGGRFGIAMPGCKPGDRVCTFYGGAPLYILRWPTIEALLGAEHADEPAVFCGTAYIPHLMKQHQRDNARLGDDEIFIIR